MLKLRPIGINDYLVLESGQRIGQIRPTNASRAFGSETSPSI